MKTKLGRQEIQLLAYLQMRKRERVDAELLRKLERALKPSTSLIPWIPTKPKRGTVNRRWGVVVNEQA